MSIDEQMTQPAAVASFSDAHEAAAQKSPGFWKRMFRKGNPSPSLTDEPQHLQPFMQEEPPPVNGHVPDRPSQSAFRPALPRRSEPVPISADDAIINRFEALLVHGPKNIKFLTTLAEAYARKGMFDRSLSFYQQTLDILGGENASIEKAMAETNLKQLDLELSRLDPEAPEAAALRERIQNQQLENKWHEMEEAH